MKASAFEEACQFLSCYLEMEHPGYTTRDVLAGIERLQAVTGVGDVERARWYIERALPPGRHASQGQPMAVSGASTRTPNSASGDHLLCPGQAFPPRPRS